MSNLGANFKKARESLGIPIEKIAAETRISVRFLTAIENDDFRSLPGGVFNRGFIKAYAEQVGLNPDTALADYDRLGLSPEEPVEALRTVERESRKNSERHLYPAAGLLLILLIVGYYLTTRNSSTEEVAAPQEAAAEQVTTPPAPKSEPPALAPASVEAKTEQTPALTSPPTPPATTVPPVTMIPVTPPQPAAAVTSTPTPALVLDVDVTERSWVKVTADGTVAQSGELPAGTTRRFTANNSIALSVGNAGGTSVKINGRDSGPLGPPGRVRQYTITPGNYASIKFQ